MMRSCPLAVLLGALVVLSSSCGDGETVAPEARVGAALGRLDRAGLDAGPTVLVEVRSRTGDPEGDDEAADGARQADARIGLSWTFDPPVLRVYRSTALHFRLDAAPRGHETASCEWSFGDGSPLEQGCTVSHTFHGGQADQVVTLTLHDGAWEWTSTRTVPLERLPVVAGLVDDEVGVGELPPPPKAGPTSFRFALIADSAATGGVPETVRQAVGSLLSSVKPELIVHVGGVVARDGGDAAWDTSRDAIRTPLEDAGIPIAWSMSPGDRAEGSRVRRPNLQMLDGRGYPERYTFTYKGAFFLVFGIGDGEGVDEETIQWMRDELGKARVYEARFVVTYLPLHKFADEHVGSLDKRFRLYELFLRGRVTTLFSAGYRTYFKGRYGALPVVSVGALVPPGGQLAGTAFKQPPSYVTVDVVKGTPDRVFAVQGPDFVEAFDETQLPDTVEVYTR